MRFLFVALILLVPVGSFAASPEEEYLAARDAVIAKMKEADKPGANYETIAKGQEKAIADVEAMLRRIVGPVAIKGLSGPGRSNVETYTSSDVGFGSLDGIVYATADDKLRVVVTTEGLLASWIRGHKDWWGDKMENVPQQVDAALKWPSFYTQAISADAAIGKYAEIPVTQPAGATFAYAMLVARSQEITPATPDEIIVSVIMGGHMYLVSAGTAVKVTRIKACDAVWRAAEKKAKAALDAYSASDPKNEKLFEKYTSLQNEGAAAFARCFDEHAKGEKFFPALVAQAKELMERLPAK